MKKGMDGEKNSMEKTLTSFSFVEISELEVKGLKFFSFFLFLARATKKRRRMLGKVTDTLGEVSIFLSHPFPKDKEKIPMVAETIGKFSKKYGSSAACVSFLSNSWVYHAAVEDEPLVAHLSRLTAKSVSYKEMSGESKGVIG